MGLIRRHIGYKIILVVCIVTSVSLFFTGWFYSTYQEKSIIEQNSRTMEKLVDSVLQGLQTIMLVGYADVAQVYADRLKDVAEVVDFRILRVDGLEAFRDNSTIDSVNERRGEELFIPRDKEFHVPVILSTDAALVQVIRTKNSVVIESTNVNGEHLLTYLAPILNGKQCRKCHGRDHEVRGVLKFTSSLAPVEKDIRETRLIAFVIMSLVLTIILVIVGFVLFRTVIRPLSDVTTAMDRAASGDLTKKIPVFGEDEIGQMAGNFNVMSDKLSHTYKGLQNEKDKLSTIILSAREGIVVTDSKRGVVLVNPAAEKLLGKSFQLIKEQGFVSLIDDPGYINNWLAKSHSDTETEPEDIEYNNLVLNLYASTIHDQDGDVVGSAALIRDVTEQVRLEEELRALSSTDALTGLFNRRFLDTTLQHEVVRSVRYNINASILMFDVDHFKIFNDTYGHDQGDRVLQAIAVAMRHIFRNVDFACRYGGEEFIGILPDTSLEGAVVAAERLRAYIEEMVVDDLKVTISIGVATVPLMNAKTAAELIEAADKAMYIAKDAGRNQVKVATIES
jgi:diguanylate cyclase (GGDEF)-like protein/PAS domain S-box-containing protein